MPVKGPSFAGPTTNGWSASSLVPKASVTSALPTPAVAPVESQGNSDLSKYNLTPSELGVAPNLRVAQPQATPLEQLLSAMFPDAAANFSAEGDPMADPRNPGARPSLLNTILGNLQAQPSSATGFVPAPFNPTTATPNIPGAPAFLQGAVSGLSQPQIVVPVQGANPLNSLAAVSSIAAEQRIQQAEQEKLRKQAEADYFAQQQEKQKAKAMVDQRQRQRAGFTPSGTNSGWATNPILY